MPKIIQMPRRITPENKNEDRPVHGSMILGDTFEESESLAKIKRWLEMADTALEKPTESKNRTA